MYIWYRKLLWVEMEKGEKPTWRPCFRVLHHMWYIITLSRGMIDELGIWGRKTLSTLVYGTDLINSCTYMGQTLSTLAYQVINTCIWEGKWLWIKLEKEGRPTWRSCFGVTHHIQSLAPDVWRCVWKRGSYWLIGFLATGYEPMPSLINSDVSGGTY